MASANYWQQVEELFHAALREPAADRAPFLAARCADNQTLSAEVATLLAAHEAEAAKPLAAPVSAVADRLLTAAAEGALVGQRLGQYQLLSLLGCGGMGEVYLAYDDKLRRQVALKRLLNPAGLQPHMQARFIREAQAAAQLDHPNVCTVYEVRDTDGDCFIVMQYVAGETLAARLKRGRLEPSAALAIAVQIADALVTAHQAGVIHRDIKPQNIMLNAQGAVKVLDFGIAELRVGEWESGRVGEWGIGEGLRPFPHSPTPSLPNSPTRPGQILGTPGYLAPEQAEGATVDARCDLFSLGVVLFEMLTGVVPFAAASATASLAKTREAEPPPLTHYWPSAPPALTGLLKQALAKQPEQRYQTAAEMLADLQRLQQSCALPQPARRALRRWQVGAALLLVLALVVTFFFGARRPKVSAALKSPATPAAYEAYQKGRAALNYESGGHGIRKEAVEHFTRVIELEPSFAPAYAALALAYNNLHDHDVPRVERTPKAKEAALKALAFDFTLAEAHITLAEIYFEYEWRFAEALREYELALSYDPSQGETFARYAIKLAELGRFAEAQAALQRAAQLAPYSEHQDGHRAAVLLFAREYDQLSTLAQEMLVKYGARSAAKRYLGQAYCGKGQYEKALELLTDGKPNPPATSLLGVTYALAGRRAEAVQVADRLRATAHDHAFSVARIYAALGETETALAWLEKAYARREAVLITLKVDLAFDRLRSEPRFAELLRRVGFTP